MTSHNFFVMLKPDAVKRKLVGEIISRFEKRNYSLLEMRKVVPTKDILEKHYAEHYGKSFYNGLIEFMLSGPVIIIKFNGDIKVARTITGDTTYPERGSIRGDFTNKLPENLIHCSDNQISAERELKLWFE